MSECINGMSHTILLLSSVTSDSKLDKEEVCIKCGKIIADIKWNGMYHERTEYEVD